MIQMKERRVCRLIFFQTMLCYVEGISLYPASDLTTQSFSLVCDLEGTSALNAFSFTYNGTSAGGCGSPPSPSCFSLIGTIAWSDQMVNFTLHQNEITSKGNAEWTCTHGTDTASFFTRVIALCTNIEVKYADSNMDISCSCGYPSVQAEVEYKASQNGNSLKRQTFDLASSPAINCTTDTRAMDYSTKIENFPSGTKEVCATVKTYSQTTTPKTICKSVPDCFLDIFLYGFLPVFLIVLIVSIVFIIIMWKECLPKQFGELTKKRLGVIVAFILVAIIIGVCLGLLIKGCDKKFLALGLSIFFAILLVVALILTPIIYHKKFESRNGSQGGQGQDNNGDNSNNTSSTATKAPIGRTRNKAGVPKGEQSALKQKEINTPLPSPPSQPPTAFAHNLPLSRTNQLPPLAKENEEANTTEKKKKKKKKRRKKSEEAGENVDKIQDDDNDN